MGEKDIRWIQRFEHFTKALNQLTKFMERENLNELEEQGLIKSFEYTYELSWNLLKDFYETQGETNIQGSRDAFRLAFKRGLIANGEVWMDMIKSRALTVHTYDEKITKKITTAIRKDYFAEFQALSEKLSYEKKNFS